MPEDVPVAIPSRGASVPLPRAAAEASAEQGSRRLGAGAVSRSVSGAASRLRPLAASSTLRGWLFLNSLRICILDEPACSHLVAYQKS